jgi:hypothetical protein
MQKQMSDPNKKEALFETLANLKNEIMSEPQYKTEEAKVRNDKIFDALNIKAEIGDDRIRENILRTIIQGTEFDDEIRKMCSLDKTDIETYKFAMQKDVHIEQYRNILDSIQYLDYNCNVDFKVDYSHLNDRGYLEFLNERVNNQMSQCKTFKESEEYTRLSNSIDNIIQNSPNATIESTLRNLEKAYNQTSLTDEQKKIIENEARMIIYNEAIKQDVENSSVLITNFQIDQLFSYQSDGIKILWTKFGIFPSSMEKFVCLGQIGASLEASY